ncbi:general transcription factor 3C polypeptide 5-like [Limulus polyphemus]|uniref:General transcription factor 3C polypeptide 5-like n=1 Tax=Limulus polyphemus TaxID=6850 RepID=A0ABM1B7T8_LIMPO|nr:general transcription factor 3C polypeptide 5-like [Limulus polyphemus]XP_022243865.1 general transcription factor 3C polypeptide 5-like [Limulus polyphemus]
MAYRRMVPPPPPLVLPSRRSLYSEDNTSDSSSLFSNTVFSSSYARKGVPSPMSMVLKVQHLASLRRSKNDVCSSSLVGIDQVVSSTALADSDLTQKNHLEVDNSSSLVDQAEIEEYMENNFNQNTDNLIHHPSRQVDKNNLEEHCKTEMFSGLGHYKEDKSNQTASNKQKNYDFISIISNTVETTRSERTDESNSNGENLAEAKILKEKKKNSSYSSSTTQKKHFELTKSRNLKEDYSVDNERDILVDNSKNRENEKQHKITFNNNTNSTESKENANDYLSILKNIRQNYQKMAKNGGQLGHEPESVTELSVISFNDKAIECQSSSTSKEMQNSKDEKKLESTQRLDIASTEKW